MDLRGHGLELLWKGLLELNTAEEPDRKIISPQNTSCVATGVNISIQAITDDSKVDKILN